MSGILGLWNLDGRPVDKDLLARMSATLAHRGPDGESLWIAGPIGLACQLFRITPESSTETQPLVYPSGLALVFDGRLDNREELLSVLPHSLGFLAHAPDPVLVLAAYRAFGERFPERLLGDFAFGLFDPFQQKLILARDPIGVRPLYYARAGRTLLFASEIKALLAHPEVTARPDDDALADFLLGRMMAPTGLTFFKGISSLEPAHLATVTPQTLTITRYWDFDLSRQASFDSFTDCAEAFRAVLTRAVTRRMRSATPVAVSVSGGLDSSSIFCLAETTRRAHPGRHPPLLGVSYTSPHGTASDEQAFLKEIEREYALSIHRIPMGPPGLLQGSKDLIRHVEGPLIDELGATTIAFHRTVHELGSRVLLTGHWADQVLVSQSYLVDLFYRLSWGRVVSHLRMYKRWYADADFKYFLHRFLFDLIKYSSPNLLLSFVRRYRLKPARPWFTEAIRARARARAPRNDLRLNGPGSAHARALYEEARSTHHVLCMEWNNKVGAMHGVEVAFPFLDRDLLSFLMSLPGELQTWNGIPKVLLREGLRGVLPDAITRRNWKADFTYVVNNGVMQDFGDLVEFLRADSRAVHLGYLQAEKLRERLDRAKEQLQDSSAEAAWGISQLLGLELWLRTFIAPNT